jgi:hypothetical protein
MRSTTTKSRTSSFLIVRSACCLVCVLLVTDPTSVHAEEQDTERLKFFGDGRLRLEQDWDSLQGDGTKRDDRLRLRVRLRAGVALVQARTGPHLSQQSPHLTIYDFDGGPTGPAEFNFDHWYLNRQSGGLSAWVGRNELSAWHQDDMFVFDNVTYPGVGATYRHSAGAGDLSWHFNYVALPVGMRDVSGTGTFAQVAYERNYDKSGFTVAGGFFGTNADPDDPAGEILLTENNTRDYRIFDLQLQYRSRAGDTPYELQFDYSRNAKNYDDAPVGSFSEFHKDDVNGYVFGLQVGEQGGRGDWQFGYYYAYLEALTVHSSYIQDDWVRWGNANQVRATNLKGSEFRVIYTIRPGMNIFARLFFVDAIDLLEPGDTAKETGNRFRVDWNVAF